MDTHRLIVADGVDLRTKHYSCESEEEDGFQTEEDQQQHRHPWREVTALWSEEERGGEVCLMSTEQVKCYINHQLN